MVECLADQDDFGSGTYQFLHCPNTFRLQARLQLVFKIFLTQKVQAVPCDSTENHVYDPGGELAIRRIENGPEDRHQEDEPAAPNAFGEGLSIPSEESDWPDNRQVKKAPFNPPVNGGGRTGVVVGRFQNSLKASIHQRL
jgi:hypothetical protein